jgi:hypothetical protein
MNMQTKYAPYGTHENVSASRSVFEAQGNNWIGAGAPKPQLRGQHAAISSSTSEGPSPTGRSDSFPGIADLVVVVPPGLVLPKGKNITISVIAGPSKGLAVQMVKPHLSIGRSGGGADIEIDDPQLSDLHCAVGVKNEMIRMCDLDSQSGTYIEDERVDVADLAHLSEFRVGSSLLLVRILPAEDASLTPAV